MLSERTRKQFFSKGRPFNKELNAFLQCTCTPQYTMAPLCKDALLRGCHYSRKDTNYWQQVL